MPPGRDGAVAVLDAAWRRASSGTAQLVVVEGEAGIGKTTLPDAFVGLVGTSVLALGARCDELSRVLPLQPVFEAISAQLGARDDDAALLALDGDAALLLGLESQGPVGPRPVAELADRPWAGPACSAR